jgi:hypothetical protein
MNRPLAAVLLATALSAAATPAAFAGSADRCRPRAGEDLLARSGTAAVFARLSESHQTITGCSRRTGRRRTIDRLERDGENALVGLRLAGTRVAYVRWSDDRDRTDSRLLLTTDDALHGGRRHVLAYGAPYLPPDGLPWTVDADGDVAWLARVRYDTGRGASSARPVLVAWRPRSGQRQIDARANLSAPRLTGGVLRWRRNGRPRSLDLTTIAHSSCRFDATAGTLAIDMIATNSVCLRATGGTVDLPFSSYGVDLLDANGPYVVLGWIVHTHEGAYVYDAMAETLTPIDPTPADADDLPYGPIDDAVVTDHGSIAWIVADGLWVRDAAGTRRVPGTGTGPLLRDGSTVTWSGGGPTVTLNP